MNIVMDISQCRLENIHLLETKSNIVMDGNFTKIIYSDDSISINGVYVLAPFLVSNINDGFYNNNLIYFNPLQNAALIKEIGRLEHNVLSYYKKVRSIDKINGSPLMSQLHNGNVKVYRETAHIHGSKYFLKISGVWENTSEIGITYKFIETN